MTARLSVLTFTLPTLTGPAVDAALLLMRLSLLTTTADAAIDLPSEASAAVVEAARVVAVAREQLATWKAALGVVESLSQLSLAVLASPEVSALVDAELALAAEIHRLEWVALRVDTREASDVVEMLRGRGGVR